MNRKVIIISVIALLLGLFLWWLLSPSSPSPTAPLGSGDFLPFGQGDGGSSTGSGSGGFGGSETSGDGSSSEAELPPLRLISALPISGATTLIDEETGELRIRYVERSSGHIFEANTLTATRERLSNTTIPKIQEALWVEEGTAVIMRYLQDDTDTIQSFYGRIVPKEDTEESELEGVFLPENMARVAVSPDGENIFYLLESGSGSTGIVADTDGGGRRQIFTSPITEWLPEWSSKNTITLSTKPSFNLRGYSYFLNTTSSALESVLQRIRALTTTTNPSTLDVLYSKNDSKDRLSLNVRSRESGEVEDLGIPTFAEKCVWSAFNSAVLYCAVPSERLAGEYPDLWYQGVDSFSDTLWSINTASGESDRLISLEREAGREIDVIDLFLDEEEEFLFFTNKSDLSFWSFELE